MRGTTDPRMMRALKYTGFIVWILVGLALFVHAVRGGRPASPRAVAEGPAELVAPTDSPAPAYRSEYKVASGAELVLVFVGASFCGAHRTPGFPQWVEDAKVRLQATAHARDHQFRAVAVSLDWDIEEALAFVRSFGRFDEVALGGNWVSDGAVRYVWETYPGEPVVPQLIVLERSVAAGEGGIRFGPGRVLRRLVGVDGIEEWVRSGAQL